MNGLVAHRPLQLDAVISLTGLTGLGLEGSYRV